MENAFVVTGGNPLKGEVQLSGAKNIALKVIVAALLFDQEVHLHNIPRLNDIEELMHLIRLIGGKAEFVGNNEVVIDGRSITTDTIDLLHASKVRVSFMFFAPLLRKFKKAKVPNPGGCRIGARHIDRPIEVLRNMGVTVDYHSDNGYYTASIDTTLKASHHTFEKATHTGTEFAIMLGAIAQGETIIENASLEPEIDDLIRFLNESGAHIVREKKRLIIQGTSSLSRTESYTIENDRNEAATYACFALATKGDITIVGIQPSQLATFIMKVKEIGGGVEEKENAVRFYYTKPLMGTDIVAEPHPGFMTDWQGPWAILMTQANGISTIHETIYENRFAYVEELSKVGAKIEFYKPEVENPETFYQFNYDPVIHKNAKQAIRIYGPTTLHNGVLNVADLRAGATLLIAAMVASGESIINGVSIVERGYEHIADKLSKLGGIIKKV
jgi:UDP-N-acetylglucosamine 1-carboxyvinyltransferase